MTSFSRIKLEKWLSTLTAKGQVLDVGGSQNPIEGRVKIAPSGAHFTILDLETPHELRAKADIVGDLNEPLALPCDAFDQAFCIEVSEYWWEPHRALRNIYKALKPGGRLFISFHFIYPIHNPENQDYLRYTREGARKLLKESGFEIDEIRAKGYAEPMNVMRLYEGERMRGVGKNAAQIHHEQGWLISCTKIGI